MSNTLPEKIEFLKYILQADTLCLGERVRGGLLRPCSGVFRYNSLTCALSSHFGLSTQVHAVGRFVQHTPGNNRRQLMSYAPQDRSRGISVLPLGIEVLVDVRAEVFVYKNSITERWPKEFTFSMGALRSKGFGRCHLTFAGVEGFEAPRKGILAVRIPEDQEVWRILGVRRVITPVYGYLFKPTSATSGVYVRSLFEGTELVGFDPILMQ